MKESRTPVLVMGGSLVGMSTGLLLAHNGVRSIVVERHRGTAIHPRAAQITQRTMEIFRAAGIEQIICARSGEQFVQDGAIMAAETLAGRELAHFIANLNEGVRDVSPTERVFISQSLLEPLLKSRAEELGADLRFSTEIVDFAQDDQGVTARLRHRDTGAEEHVRADYMVAADGAAGATRARLGIGTRGHGVFSKSITIYFRADVNRLLRGRNLSVIYVNNPVLRGFFRFEKPFTSGFLAINGLGDPDHPQTDVATGLTEARALELIRVALGADDVPITIDNMMPWNAAADVAERYRQGRVFLAGDSAHIMPPNGGFGGNTGVQDAHNLAWKLAMVLRGEADPALLDTYEVERQPVGAFTVEQAYSRYVTRTAPYLGTEGMQPLTGDLDVELGYAYVSGALCDGRGPAHEDPRASKGRPGTRAPHVWLQQEGQRISTIDLFCRTDGPDGLRAPRIALVAAAGASGWCDAARRVASRLNLRVDVHRIGDRLLDPGNEMPGAYGIGSAGAVLVRPDGFIAWRSDSPAPQAPASDTTLAGAFHAVTCRQASDVLAP